MSEKIDYKKFVYIGENILDQFSDDWKPLLEDLQRICMSEEKLRDGVDGVDFDGKELKGLVIRMLRATVWLGKVRRKLLQADGGEGRLLEYFDGLAACEVEGEKDLHNLYELLGGLRFLRVLLVYDWNAEKCQIVRRMYEGRWEKMAVGGWRYVEGSGGLLFSGLSGRQHYRLTGIQVLMLMGIFGPMHWVNTGVREGERALLPTERVVYATDGLPGAIYDRRRCVREVNFFIPRKFCKTTMGAFLQFEGFFCEDANYEGYCCANSQEQSKILFRMASDMIRQLDPQGEHIRFTQTEVSWRRGEPREGRIVALSAGGKTKDGLFAQYCSCDEYGSAGYVKGRSDMAGLVEVVRSSMGPRREPLTIHTTTAGSVLRGPYELKLEGIRGMLRCEVLNWKEAFCGGVECVPSNALDACGVDLDRLEQCEDDWQFALLLEPDEWEKGDVDTLLTKENVWRKVNPHIGVTVQGDYYQRRVRESLADEETKRETLNKLFNVFTRENVIEWVTTDDVRRLMVGVDGAWPKSAGVDPATRYAARSVEDCDASNGWMVFVGLDFSLGDDLNAVSYLAFNKQTGQMLADMDAWVSREALERSSVRMLLEGWAKDGWLHVCEGRTFQPEVVVGRLRELSDKVLFRGFGYDAYQGRQVVNDLRAWVWGEGADPDAMVVPVSQGFANYNGAVMELDYLIRGGDGLLAFSRNPMWLWEFGNVALKESADGMGNKKPVKRMPGADGCKVDNVQCLCTALILFDKMDGKVE